MKKKLNASLAALFLIVVVAFMIRATNNRLDYMSEGAPPTYGFETSQIAASVAAGHGFGNPYPLIHSGPTALMPPVYIYLLAGIFKVFGVQSDSSYLMATTLSAFFSTLVCIPIFFLGKRVAGNPLGLAAATLWAVFPLSIDGTIGRFGVWDTTLSALLATLVLLATLRMRDSERTGAWIGYGILCALALEVNPAILSVLPFLLAWLAWSSYERRRAWLRLPALAAILIVLGCAPWAARNWEEFHHFIPFRSNFGLELWLGNNQYEDHDQFPDRRSPYSNGLEAQRYASIGEVAFMREKKANAIQFIETHPWETLRSDYIRFAVTWTGMDAQVHDVWPLLSASARIVLVVNFLFVILGWAGLWAMFRQRSACAWPFSFFIVIYPAVYYVTHATLRYRYPIDPTLAVLSTFAVFCAARALARPFRRASAQSPSAGGPQPSLVSQ